MGASPNVPSSLPSASPSPSSSSGGTDMSRPKRVTVGFNAPVVAASSAVAVAASTTTTTTTATAATSSASTAILGSMDIPTSERDLSQAAKAYRTQIPGWSGDSAYNVDNDASTSGSVAASRIVVGSLPLDIAGGRNSLPRGSLSVSMNGGIGAAMATTSTSTVTAAASMSSLVGTTALSKSPLVNSSIASILPTALLNAAAGKNASPPPAIDTAASAAHASSSPLTASPAKAPSESSPSTGPSTDAAAKQPSAKLKKAEKKAFKQAQRAAKLAAAGTAESNATVPPSRAQHQQGQQQHLPSSGTKQEQRAYASSPLAGGSGGSGERRSSKTVVDFQQQQQSTTTGASGAASTSTSTARRSSSKCNNKEVPLFSHLASCTNRPALALRKEMRSKGQDLHPAIVRLGLAYQNHTVIGSNNRCIALMEAFREVIADYETPANNTLCRHLDSYLKPQINYLVACRPLSVSMGNAIRFLKLEIANIPPETLEEDSKQFLDDRICTYVRDRILCADEVIVELAMTKIRDGDVILTYGNSTAIRQLLISAYMDYNISFRVIIVDSRPLNEGRVLLKELTAHGISCTYVQLSGLTFAIKEASKVFLGAHAMLSNGTLMGRIGTAMIAMMAHNHGLPVIVTCETYKFSDRVQLDSFVNNELGDPETLVDQARYLAIEESVLKFGVGAVDGAGGSASSTPVLERKTDSSTSLFVVPGGGHAMASGKTGVLAGWTEQPNLRLLNLMFDVTPSQFISVVITEIGMIPCSSVPVVVRTSQAYSANGN